MRREKFHTFVKGQRVKKIHKRLKALQSWPDIFRSIPHINYLESIRDNPSMKFEWTEKKLHKNHIMIIYD